MSAPYWTYLYVSVVDVGPVLDQERDHLVPLGADCVYERRLTELIDDVGIGSTLEKELCNQGHSIAFELSNNYVKSCGSVPKTLKFTNQPIGIPRIFYRSVHRYCISIWLRYMSLVDNCFHLFSFIYKDTPFKLDFGHLKG